MKTSVRLLTICVVGIWFWLAPAAPLSASVADNTQDVTEQTSAVELIDYEILLLRTEIALRNNDLITFKQFMSQLTLHAAPSQFATRVSALQQQYLLLTASPSDIPAVQFDQAAAADVIVILLPLSGDYAEAGQALLEPIQQALATKTTYVIDTSLYDDMVELWALVKLFKPGLIIGPLERHKAEGLLAIGDPIPMFLFTNVGMSVPHVRSMAPLALTNAISLVDTLSFVDIKQIAWITDQSSRAEEVVEAVVERYLVDKQVDFTPKIEKMSNGLDKSLAKQLGVEQSQVRKNWLQRTLGRDLEYVVHVREDKKIIVALMSAQYAMQLKPLLDYYARPLPVLWVPTELPDAKNFNATLGFWQQTFALLPTHFAKKVDGKIKKITEDVDVGIFYALAEITIEMVRHADRPLPYEFQTTMGRVVVQTDGKYAMFPELYELNEGRARHIRAEQVLQKIDKNFSNQNVGR